MGSLAPTSITVKYRCGGRLHSCGLVSFPPSFCKRGEPGLSSALSGLTMPSGAVFRQQCPLPGLDRVHSRFSWRLPQTAQWLSAETAGEFLLLWLKIRPRGSDVLFCLHGHRTHTVPRYMVHLAYRHAYIE